jgi:hypothetical protein
LDLDRKKREKVSGDPCGTKGEDHIIELKGSANFLGDDPSIAALQAVWNKRASSFCIGEPKLPRKSPGKRSTGCPSTFSLYLNPRTCEVIKINKPDKTKVDNLL